MHRLKHDWHRVEGWLPACRACGARDTGDNTDSDCPGSVDRSLYQPGQQQEKEKP